MFHYLYSHRKQSRATRCRDLSLMIYFLIMNIKTHRTRGILSSLMLYFVGTGLVMAYVFFAFSQIPPNLFYNCFSALSASIVIVVSQHINFVEYTTCDWQYQSYLKIIVIPENFVWGGLVVLYDRGEFDIFELLTPLQCSLLSFSKFLLWSVCL